MVCIDPDKSFKKKKNKSLRCNYHGHDTNRCRSLKFLMEKPVKVGHLRRYIKEVDHIEESGPTVDRIATGAATLSKPIPIISRSANRKRF